ncbi:hypothetical protein ABZY06_29655 [Streptomyces sp. NPDC006540]|jgi:hypothetical protein|uniref:hypothetical protein n=1 Tax=Streptomyces sp. NPDC006540 TaxID=3155353 RepID=UPI0033B31997
MKTPTKITAFAAALAASFGAAYGVGNVVAPVDTAPAPAAHSEHPATGRASEEPGGHGPSTAGGLQISEGGYTLDLDTPRVPAGRASELRFTVRDDDGRPVTAYQREHDKELHLILASRDLGTYRHLHPTRAADGTWSIAADLPKAGDYRLFADFTPAAEDAKNLTLGADLAVSGAYRPAPLPAAAKVAEVDGYTVTLDGALHPAKAGELKLSVSRDGRPVTDLEPYLGAYGHLVALRSGDLAYLHVHPGGEPGDGTTRPGPEVTFTATAPSPGAYRLFLDFKHEGKVRTAAFTVVTADAPGEGTGTQKNTPGNTEESHDGSGDGHSHE